MPMVVEAIPDERGGEELADGERRYTRQHRVHTFDLTVTEFDVLFATGVPRLGDSHPSDLVSLCIQRRARETPDYGIWIVESEYSTRFGDVAQLQEANPLLKPAVLSWDVEFEEVAFEKDLAGLDLSAAETPEAAEALIDILGGFVGNTAGDPYDPPITKRVAYYVLTIQRNEASFDSNAKLTFINTLNKEAFFGHAARKCMMLSIVGNRVWEGTNIYYPTTYRIAIKSRQDLRVLNAGYQQLVAGQRRPIHVGSAPAQSPQPLAANGTALAVGGTPIFNTHVPYPDKSWGPLNLS